MSSRDVRIVCPPALNQQTVWRGFNRTARPLRCDLHTRLQENASAAGWTWYLLRCRN